MYGHGSAVPYENVDLNQSTFINVMNAHRLLFSLS